MSDDSVSFHFKVIRQRLAALQTKQDADALQEIDEVLEDLHVVFEQMQTNLEASELSQANRLQQNRQITQRYYHYRDLFQSSPIAYLVTDASGVILEANQAIAQLFNTPQSHLTGKPLVLYVGDSDRPTFYTHLSRLSHCYGTEVWQMVLRPRENEPFIAHWHVAIARAANGQIETLRIAIHPLSQPLQSGASSFGTEISELQNAPLTGRQPLDAIRVDRRLPMSLLPQSLDGLRVLVVDDEADIREFITAILESHNIEVLTVANTAAALEALEQFRPDVLMSDIRMPHEDGYSLIQQIRALEVVRGGHIPAAAITAYVDEDQERSINAGFEAHLHKLARPAQWVELVAQLARGAARLKDMPPS